VRDVVGEILRNRREAFRQRIRIAHELDGHAADECFERAAADERLDARCFQVGERDVKAHALFAVQRQPVLCEHEPAVAERTVRHEISLARGDLAHLVLDITGG
jgi:hypothetical protein